MIGAVQFPYAVEIRFFLCTPTEHAEENSGKLLGNRNVTRLDEVLANRGHCEPIDTSFQRAMVGIK